MADSDALKFKVDLVGNMVAELVAGGKAASTAEGGVQALTAAILQMTEAQKKPDKGFFTFDLAHGAEMALHFVERLAEGVVDLGKEIVNTVAQTQDLNLALRLTAGPENAKAVSDLIDSFGDTRFDDDDVKKAILPFLDVGGGKDLGLLKDIITAGMDVAARTSNPAAMQEVIDVFTRVQTKREVNGKMLMALGVNEQDFFAALGQTLGTSAKNAEAQVKAGKVRAETLQAEILGQIAQREGGSLGRATDESVTTLGTTIERFKRIPEDIFKKLAESPGIALLQQRVDHFIESLGGPAAERIVEQLGHGLDRISEVLLGNGQSVDKFIDGVVEGIPKAIKLFENLVEIIGQVASALGIATDEVKDAPQLYGRDFTVNRSSGLARLLGGTPTQNPDGSVSLGLVDRMLGSQVQFAKANDFIWRGGQAIQIDPKDDVVGAKPGGSLGIQDLGGGTPRLGAMMQVTYAPVHNWPAGVTEQTAQRIDESNRAELSRMLDEARARWGN